MKTGIDVSAWQGQIDWSKAAANDAAFTFIKASQQLFTDRRFAENWRGAKAANLPRGAYHYLTWDAPVQAQAAFFRRLLSDDPGELPPVADFEESAGCPGNAAGQLRVFIESVEEALGRVVMVYTSPGFWRAHGSSEPFLGSRPLWLAHWGVARPSVPAPWSGYAFWQYSNQGDGAAYGMSSRAVDLSFAAESWAGWPLPAGIQTASGANVDRLDRLWAAHPELH